MKPSKNTRQKYLGEIVALSKIALPLILSSLASMSISITDVVMIGWLGPLELAASAAVSDFYSLCFYFLTGTIAAISPMIAQAMARNEAGTISQIVQQAILTTIILSIPGALLIFHTADFLVQIGIPESIANAGKPYSQMMTITLVTMMLVSVSHHFLAAHGTTSIIMLATIGAIPVNAFANYCLIFGHFGFSSMGLAGAGLASAITACFMLLLLVGYILNHRNFHQYNYFRLLKREQLNHIATIFRIGIPIGISNLGIMGVFLLTTVTIGVFGVESLAAHTVALRVAGIVFAVPVGFSQAATIHMAYAVGAKNIQKTYLTMKCVLSLSIAIGTLLMVLIILYRRDISGIFLDASSSINLVYLASLMIYLMAIGQPVNNLSFVGAGILRGFKDTKMPMVYSVFSFWIIGFVGGWLLALVFGLNGLGLWLALVAGEFVYAALIGYRIYRWFSVYNIRSQLRFSYDS